MNKAIKILKIKLNYDKKISLFIENEFNSIEQANENEGIKTILKATEENEKFQFSYRNNYLFFKKDWFKENAALFLEELNNAKNNKCFLCNQIYFTSKGLSSHIQFDHKMTSEDYTVLGLYENTRPICKFDECNNITRYTSFSFKEFCKEHAKEAMKVGGKLGGISEAWNKGKTKLDDPRILKQSLEASGERNHFYGKTHSEETVALLSKQRLLTKEQIELRLLKRAKDFSFNFDHNKYHSRQNQKIECVCNICSKKWMKTLVAIERGSMCGYCYPFTTSRAEVDIGDYVQSLGFNIVRNDRKIISPKEIDVVIEEKNFAIEYNGLYWHMNKGQEDFNKNYHKEKTTNCKEKNVQLFHIFSDEWQNKEDLLKSMLASRLGKANVVGARKLKLIDSMKNSSYKDFFETTHISGYTPCLKVFSLVDPNTNEIQCALSLRKPFHSHYKNCVEIARFSSKAFTNVQGGFSKLLKQAIKWAKENNFDNMLSYCDLRFGTGNVYLKSGFNLVGETEINYWYTDGVVRYDRFKFRAQPGKPEKQVAEEAGVYKIYGCSNKIYLLKLNN